MGGPVEGSNRIKLRVVLIFSGDFMQKWPRIPSLSNEGEEEEERWENPWDDKKAIRDQLDHFLLSFNNNKKVHSASFVKI